MRYYSLKKEEVLKRLSSTNKGISNSAVQKRQSEYGRNTVQVRRQAGFLSLFVNQFRTYLVWLLILIAAVAFTAGFLMDEPEQLIDGTVIAFIVLVNASAGAYQDYKSEKSAQLLTSMLRTQAVVLRDGQREVIDSEDVVPGDVIMLQAGDKVPADARILECYEFKVNESLLTGESDDVLKRSTAIKKEVPLAERRNMAYMNTYVTTGKATAVVTATGKDTEVGHIAGSLEEDHTDSIFLQEVDHASKKITYVALALILIALSAFYVQGHPWLKVFMLASALIIGSIPEALPAVVTFTLSIASMKLARENVLVKRKTLLETLGGIDVFCTDKTGTLTQNRMSVKKMRIDGDVGSTRDVMSSEAYKHFRNCALLCNEAKETRHGFVGNAEDIALVDLFREWDVYAENIRTKFPASNFEPFSSKKKYATSYNTVHKRTIKYSKGAPRVILKSCGYILREGKVRQMTKRDEKEILRTADSFSSQALRNIAFSYAYDEKGDIFLGLVGMHDPPKQDIRHMVDTIYDAGVDIKMITGDSAQTAKAIAYECGFRDIRAISWSDLKDLPHKEFIKKVKEYNVFTRTSPTFKQKIVQALQDSGHRVGITGDGVNDVPALKKAEVGVCMGDRGSDIAKESSDLILLDDNITSVIPAIREGRTIFSNIRKVLNYLLTANLAEVVVVFISSLLGLVPFQAIQLLWVNFVADFAPAFALGTDPSHKSIMTKPPTGKSEYLINKRITALTVFIGLKKVVFIFGLFYASYMLTDNLQLAQTIAFTWLILSFLVRVAAIRFDEKVNPFINPYLNWAMLSPILLQLLILYTPLSQFFHVEHLPLHIWIVLIIAVFLGILAAKAITLAIDRYMPDTANDY